MNTAEWGEKMFNVECDHGDVYDDVDEEGNDIYICYDCGEVF